LQEKGDEGDDEKGELGEVEAVALEMPSVEGDSSVDVDEVVVEVVRDGCVEAKGGTVIACVDDDGWGEASSEGDERPGVEEVVVAKAEEEEEVERACCWILSFCSCVRWRVVMTWVTMSPLNWSSTLAASCLSCRSVESLRASSFAISRKKMQPSSGAPILGFVEGGWSGATLPPLLRCSQEVLEDEVFIWIGLKGAAGPRGER
jgi:hypothetical protein